MLTVDITKTPLYQIGEENATLKNAVIMMNKFNISIDTIVKELDIKKEKLLEYIQREKVELKK